MNILATVTATYDNNINPATILVIYQGDPETYSNIFITSAYNACISIGRHVERESGDGKRIQDVPLRYTGEFPVYVSAIDKTGVTATKLLNKIRVSMQSRIELNAQSVGYTWILRQDDSQNSRMGGFDPLWQDRYTIFMRPMETP